MLFRHRLGGLYVIDQYWAVVVWRGMQGVSSGAGIVISRAIVRDLYDGDAQRLMSRITMMFPLPQPLRQ